MNAADQAPNMNDAAHALTGPGGLLRAARESAAVSLRDIAAQLHLDERTVDALERDDFKNLPAPTFVRGYLRGYARLLSVPVGPVMEAYDREGFRPPDLVADIAEAPESNATDFPISLITWAIVLVLGAMVIVWWNNNSRELADLLEPISPEQSASKMAADADRAAVDAKHRELTNTPQQQPPTPGATRLADNAATTTATETHDLAPAPVTPSAKQATAADEASARDSTLRAEEVLAQARDVLTQSRQTLPGPVAPTADQAQAQGVAVATARPPMPLNELVPLAPSDASATTQLATSADASATTGLTANRGAQDSNADQRSSAGDAHLELSFTAEAWVQVLDRDSNRLFYNLAKPGQNLDLRGPPPLRVTLGRTRGVQVRFNDKAIDVAPFTDKGVARFTLP